MTKGPKDPRHRPTIGELVPRQGLALPKPHAGHKDSQIFWLVQNGRWVRN